MKRFFSMTLAAALLLLFQLTPAAALVNGLFLGSDENGVNILNDRLRPGQEYYFPVLVAADGTPPVQLTSADLDRNRLEVRVVSGGASIQEVTVEQKGGMGYVRVLAGGKGTVQELEVKLRLNYRSKDSNDNVTVTPLLRVGYDPMADDSISSLDPGEHLTIDNRFPIIGSRQWDSLAQLNEHRPVTLQGSDWRYEVHVTGLGKRNLVYDHQAQMELVNQFPNQQLHFVSFPGAPDFGVAGKLTLDVLSLGEEYNHDFYLYRCAYGKIYPLKFDYDKELGEISFRPSQLSSYLLTDKKISLKDNQPVVDGESAADSSTPEAVPPMGNPNTGSGSNSIVAWVVSMVSLAGLGALSSSIRKR